MAVLTCCGNQPVPIIVGLLITLLSGFIDSYPLFGSAPSSASSQSLSSPASTSGASGNINLGQIVYRPNYNLAHSSQSTSSSSSSSSSSPVSSSSSQLVVPLSPSSASTKSSSSSSTSPVSQPSSQPLPPLSHHSSGLTSGFIRGNAIPEDNSVITRRPSNTYHDYFDTFRLPLITTGKERGGGRIVIGGVPNGLESGLNNQRFTFAQPSASSIDFDYVPYIQSDFNPSLPSTLAAVSSSSGSDRAGDLYEEADYNDPLYDLKYDPIEDSNNWLNEAVSSSYRQQQQQQQQQQQLQQQQQQQQQSVLPPVPYITSSSSYVSPYLISPSSDNSGIQYSPSSASASNSDDFLTNLMVNYLVKELERSAQQQQQSASSESVQHLIKLQQQQQQQQRSNTKGINPHSGGYEIEKKSFNRDKGTKSGDSSIDSAKRIEQRGQKEYPLLRPAIENNGKDDLDSESSGISVRAAPSLSTTTTTSPPSSTTERSDEEVNQLKSLLQSI